MEICHEYRAKKTILCRHSRVHPAIWMWSMDAYKCNGDISRWYLLITRILRKVFNVHWSERITNEKLCGKLPRPSDKIAARRLRLAGHCQRHPELGAHRLILWEPTHGQRGRGRPRTTFVDQLKRDTGTTTTGELAAMMKDRKIWRKAVDSRFRSRK